MNLVRHIHDPPPKHSSSESKLASKSSRTLQVRRISEEILLTLGPPSITLSPILLTLLSEVLTVQLISSIDGLDDDWFNQTIIRCLGNSPTALPLGAHPDRHETPVGERTSNHVDNISNPSVTDVTTFPSLALKPTHPFEDDDADPSTTTGQDILNIYLKYAPNSLSVQAGTASQLPALILKMIQVTPLWHPNELSLHSPTTASLVQHSLTAKLTSPSELYHDSQSAHVQSLVRAWTQLDSFRRISQITQLEPELIKSDALSLLSSLVNPLNQTIDALVLEEQNHTTRLAVLDSWKSVVIETLRRLEDSQINGVLLFQNMQDWLLDRIQLIEAPLCSPPSFQSLHTNTSMPTHTSLASQNALSSHDIVEGTADDRTCYMTMPLIPSYEHQRETDLGGSHRGQIHRRHGSSAEPQGGSPSRPISSTHLHESINHSDSIYQGTNNIPEEGDMTEGYSFEEPVEAVPSESGGRSSFDLPQSGSPAAVSAQFAQSQHRKMSITSNSDASALRDTSLSAISGEAFVLDNRPSFAVSVTDISAPGAFDSKGLVKHKRDMEFLIAVEVAGVPGFIVTRKWVELEKMDGELGKLKMIGLGTKAFPRALLPSNLNFKMSDHIVRELEGYLQHLLNDDRYAKSQPVINFFAKERSGSSKSGLINPLNTLLSSTQSTWDTIGKGVASVGNNVVAKPVNMATQGLSQLSKGVLAGLPFGAKDGSSNSRTSHESQDSRGPAEFLDQDPKGMKIEQAKTKQPSLQDRLRQFSISTNSSNNTSSESLATLSSVEQNSSQQAVQPPQAFSETIMHSPVISERLTTEPGVIPPWTMSDGLQRSSDDSQPADLSPQTPRQHMTPNTPTASTANAGYTIVSPPSSPGKSTVEAEVTKADSAVTTGYVEVSKPPKDDAELRTLSEPGPAARESSETGTTKVQTTLDGSDFEAVLIALMSVLEAAYGLERQANDRSSVGPASWSMRRGMLRVLETVVRTTSLNGQLKRAVGSVLDQIGDPEWIAGCVAVPEKKEEAKEPIDRSPEAKARRRDEARKLFVESWGTLKIGLGSNGMSLSHLYN